MNRRTGDVFMLVWFVASLPVCSAQILSIDLGHEFFKAALMRQGVPLEIVLNSHSSRKTPTAVSFHESIRVFGDDALAHIGKAPAKVPTYFHGMLGDNFTSKDDVASGGAWWTRYGLGDKFYPLKVGYNEIRGVPNFLFGEEGTESEEVLASVLQFAQSMALAPLDDKVKIRDVVITVPSNANLRHRQALVAAAEIAGLRVVTLIHEGSAFAVQRAVDYTPAKDAVEHILFYNLGSRKAEATVARFESRSAGMVAGKTAPVVTILGAAIDWTVGGHLMDLRLASAMMKKFQEKNPKLADGIATNGRALMKLIKQSQKSKAVLSANKAGQYIVESLYEDVDFNTKVTREEFEEMCKDMFPAITSVIDKAIAAANLTGDQISAVEVVGGAWRVPKVQEILEGHVEKVAGKKLPLGKHLNGEEAAALGAALVAANSSSSFRVKKIFFSDLSEHEYAVQVVSLDGSWEKNKTILYPAGTPLGGKKKLAFSVETDFAVKVFEDGVLLHEYAITGLAEIMEGKWKEYNLTGAPKLSVSVPFESSGIIEVKSPIATVEDNYWTNVTVEKPKKNSTGNTTDAKTNATEEGAEGESADAEAGSDANKTEANKTTAKDEPEVEVVLKLKKKKHEKKLVVTRKDFLPLPFSEEMIEASKKNLKSMQERESEVLAVNQLRNELEASIYSSREKTELESFTKVSTDEQREAITKLCTDLEEWMYESGASKADYEGKINELKNLVDPVKERADELEARADLPETVEEGIAEMHRSSKSIKKNMSWINETKIQDADEKLAEFEAWWAKKQEQQKALPLSEAPAFTKDEVVKKLKKTREVFEKLRKIKKPKEKKEKKGKKNETETDSKASKEDEDASLPSDPEKVEAMIKELRAKKSKAVESEDFDAAANLKAEESKLQKHLESLKNKAEL